MSCAAVELFLIVQASEFMMIPDLVDLSRDARYIR